jgi:hypothetical protein
LKKTAKKLVLSRETLSHLENHLAQVAGGATTLCTVTAAPTCKSCPTYVQPCLTEAC